MVTRSRSFEPDRFGGKLRREEAVPLLDDATWYVAEAEDATLTYDVSKGELADASFLTTDLLLDGKHAPRFQIRLYEEDVDEPGLVLTYSALTQCQARVRLPLDPSEMDRWKFEREGGWLRPLGGGGGIAPENVVRVEIAVVWTGPSAVRWCQTPLRATEDEPPRLEDPVLPVGTMLDELGQSTIHEWDGRTADESELVDRLQGQRHRADEHDSPDAFDDWGGWSNRKFEATGFFRTEHDDDRWWLVTPDGNAFWSAGLNCVLPQVTTRYDSLEDALVWLPDEEGKFADAHEFWKSEGEYVDYLVTNLVRAFGSEDYENAWSEMALGLVRRFGFNTFGNWSDWGTASDADVPYVRPLNLQFPDTPSIFRDFPDVFHDCFPEDAAEIATRLEDSVGDPAMIGYFLGNEPSWSFTSRSPAEGMLYATKSCSTRHGLTEWLADRHDEDGLADAWEMDVDIDDVAEGRWTGERELTEAAREDLVAFSSVMIDRLYGVLSDACREVDPDHLNLGTRFAHVPGDWALAGLEHVDVISLNCYDERVRQEYAEYANRFDAPILIGEWHFGAYDVGLPDAGVRQVPNQAARGEAYRTYVGDAAAKPWCVGTHYFTLYDQSALGRFDGECFNIGFLDVCHRPYESLVEAARTSHERLYDIASGAVEPYDGDPKYM